MAPADPDGYDVLSDVDGEPGSVKIGSRWAMPLAMRPKANVARLSAVRSVGLSFGAWAFGKRKAEVVLQAASNRLAAPITSNDCIRRTVVAAFISCVFALCRWFCS